MLKGQVLGNRGNRVALFLALFLGILAAVLTAVYLGSARDEGGGGGSTGVTVPVVVAAQNISAGTRVEAGMVAIKDVAEASVLTGAFGTVEDVVGKVTQVSLVTGEQVLSSKITGTELALSQFGDNPPLSLLIPQGMRGVSVQVTSVAGAGGLIRPGDYVDVILSVTVDVTDPNGSTSGRNQVAQVILQNVLVLAIDQSISLPASAEESAGQGGSPVGEANPEATTATLAVSPVHAEVLALADNCRENFSGRLSLALRSFGDASPITQRTTWPADGPPPNCASLLGVSALP